MKILVTEEEHEALFKIANKVKNKTLSKANSTTILAMGRSGGEITQTDLLKASGRAGHSYSSMRLEYSQIITRRKVMMPKGSNPKQVTYNKLTELGWRSYWFLEKQLNDYTKGEA